MPHPIYGHCWFDFDSKGNLGVECEHPPGDKHYLLKFIQRGGDMQHLIEAAQTVVEALNAGGFDPRKPPTRKPAARPGWKNNDRPFAGPRRKHYHPVGDGVDATFSIKGRRRLRGIKEWPTSTMRSR